MNPDTGRFEQLPEGKQPGKGRIAFKIGELLVFKNCVFRLEHAEEDRAVIRFIGLNKPDGIDRRSHRAGRRAALKKQLRDSRKVKAKN